MLAQCPVRPCKPRKPATPASTMVLPRLDATVMDTGTLLMLYDLYRNVDQLIHDTPSPVPTTTGTDLRTEQDDQSRRTLKASVRAGRAVTARRECWARGHHTAQPTPSNAGDMCSWTALTNAEATERFELQARPYRQVHSIRTRRGRTRIRPNGASLERFRW